MKRPEGTIIVSAIAAGCALGLMTSYLKEHTQTRVASQPHPPARISNDPIAAESLPTIHEQESIDKEDARASAARAMQAAEDAAAQAAAVARQGG